jgi:hypothetical protein
MRYGIRDDITNKPLVTTLGTFDKENIPTPLELASFSTLFVEPDYTHTKVISAYLVLGQFPSGGFTNDAKMDINNTGESKVYSIETGGYMVYGPAINDLGQAMLDQMRTTEINSDNMISPVSASDLEAAIKDSKFDLNGAADRTVKRTK